MQELNVKSVNPIQGTKELYEENNSDVTYGETLGIVLPFGFTGGDLEKIENDLCGFCSANPNKKRWHLGVLRVVDIDAEFNYWISVCEPKPRQERMCAKQFLIHRKIGTASTIK